MEYLDFQIEIGSGNGSDYPVAVIRSVAGEAHETMHFPFDEQTLDSQLSTLQNALLHSGDSHALSTDQQTMQKFGESLFKALFTGGVHDRYIVSRSLAISQNKGLRLRLAIQSAKLAALPWEFLYDPDQAQYICLCDDTPVVRYLELSSPSQPLTITPPLNILGMTASPKNLPDLDVAREKQRIETALADLQTQGLAKLTWLPGSTWEDLQQAMLTGPWHIFHFVGHGGFDPGTNDGIIALEDSVKLAHYLDATDLALLLADHHPLRLIVLNSCEGARGSTDDIFSSMAATLVRRGIPAVLANQYNITDEAAIGLSRTFYKALCKGKPVDTALSEARKAIKMGIANTLEWGTPVLSIHIPDGVILNIAQPTSQSSSAVTIVLPEAAPTKPSLSQPSYFGTRIIAIVVAILGLIIMGFGSLAIGSNYADPGVFVPALIVGIVLIIIGGFLIYTVRRNLVELFATSRIIAIVVAILGLIIIGVGGLLISTYLIAAIVLIIIGGFLIYTVRRNLVG